jgi:hypothetical protein
MFSEPRTDDTRALLEAVLKNSSAAAEFGKNAAAEFGKNAEFAAHPESTVRR